MSTNSPMKGSAFTMFKFHEEAELLKALLTSDVLNSAKAGTLRYDNAYITEVFLAKWDQLLIENHLEHRRETYQRFALQALQNAAGVSAITFPDQLELDDYEKWKRSAKDSKPYFSYYAFYAYESVRDKVAQSNDKPILMMDGFEDNLKLVRDMKKTASKQIGKEEPNKGGRRRPS